MRLQIALKSLNDRMSNTNPYSHGFDPTKRRPSRQPSATPSRS